MADGLNVKEQQAKGHPAGAIPKGLNTTITSLDVRAHCELSRVPGPAHSAPIRPKTDQKTPSLTIKTCLLLLHGNTSPFIISTGNIQQVLISIRYKMQLGASTNKAHSQKYTPKIYPPCDAASFWYLHGGTPERRSVLCILTRVEAAITESISTWNTRGVEECPYLAINNLHMQGHKSLTYQQHCRFQLPDCSLACLRLRAPDIRSEPLGACPFPYSDRFLLLLSMDSR